MGAPFVLVRAWCVVVVTPLGGRPHGRLASYLCPGHGFYDVPNTSELSLVGAHGSCMRTCCADGEAVETWQALNAARGKGCFDRSAVGTGERKWELCGWAGLFYRSLN